MKSLIFAVAILLSISASSVSAQTVIVLDRPFLHDYAYERGGVISATNNTTATADFTGATAGDSAGFGSGGFGRENAANIVDPTIPGQSVFTITGLIEGYGAVFAGSTYTYAAEIIFQDFGNDAGLSSQNSNTIVAVPFNISAVGGAGPQPFSVVLDLNSVRYNRGSIDDIATLLNVGELDDILVNLDAPQGTNFYGADDFAGFTVSDALVTQTVVPILLGDVNQGGFVNFQDIFPFIEVLASDTYLAQADCNEDGVVNFLDIDPFITILTQN